MLKQTIKVLRETILGNIVYHSTMGLVFLIPLCGLVYALSPAYRNLMLYQLSTIDALGWSITIMWLLLMALEIRSAYQQAREKVRQGSTDNG